MRTPGFRLLLAELRESRGALRRVALWSAVEALPPLGYGLLLAAALDRGFLAGRPLEGLLWLLAMGVLMLAGAGAQYAMFPALAAVVEPLRDRLVLRVVRSALSRAVLGAERPDTAAVARLTQHVEMVRNLVSALIRQLRTTLVTLLAGVAGLAALAPQVLLVVGAPLLIAAFVFARSLRGLARVNRRSVLAREGVSTATTEMLEGVRDIVACGAEQRALADLDRALEEQVRSSRAVAHAETTRTGVLLLGAQLPLVALLLSAPWLLSGGTVTPGELLAAVAYVSVTLQPAVRSLIAVVGGWGLQLGTLLTRIAEQSWTPLRRPPGGRPPTPGDLTATGLTFAYGPHAEPVVAGLDLFLTDGCHLAVVGPSGIGKSTLAGLLTGLLSPRHGEVRLGGVPLPDLDEAALRRTVALIPQEAYVFAGTLRDNLAYLNPDAADGQLAESCAALGAADLVTRLGGLDAEVPDTLSQGERQLIALVRVHVSAARVVVLDEATCHLDAAAEATVERAFAARGGILVVIAHRISSAMRARQVLVMDGARAELGTHESLRHANPLYAGLSGHWAADPAPAGT
ncbi:ABC transporter ATP-binding protein [Acrocarpospora phusangensis]|uniref:ABC transporter ATP-binding protein n=1 Tax=Acrocarpospora phusangensis TaxID=1070424 RepID=A0A919Q7W5_9ACTN|nr:ABC transporter ATP-binding protein [Acrocarpospora phusangensis]GIH23831.1 ABC transporter ATP-binding protein [Acrocarpospora phusangensis]